MSLPPYSESLGLSQHSKATPDLPPYDQIPSYTPSLAYYGVALLKKEFDTPWTCSNSSTKAVFLELNSNQLNIYSLRDKALAGVVESLIQHQNTDNSQKKSNNASRLSSDNYNLDGDAYGEDCADSGPNVFGKLRQRYLTHKAGKKLAHLLDFPAFAQNGMLLEPTSDGKTAAEFVAAHRGSMLHSFTLLNLQIGAAPSTNSVNYKEDLVSSTSHAALLKQRNCLRLRIEYTQLLLEFWSFYSMIHWYRNLCIGRDLSSSLDTRNVSKLKSIPRDYSASNVALLSAVAREALRGVCHKSYLTKSGETGSLRLYSDSDSDSVMSRCTHVTSCSSVGGEVWNSSIDVCGQKLVCYEDVYTPLEKQYISNCIPALNSYDKWVGAKVTVLNYEQMLPKNDGNNVNENGRVYILPMSFCSSVKNYQKRFSSFPDNVKKECKDFYVDEKGLVSIDCA